MCLQGLRLPAEGVRFLACCDGGSFACPACVATHGARPGGHPPAAEVHPVRQAVLIRRWLGIGEFARD